MSMEAFERTDGGASLLSQEPRWPWMDEAACRDANVDEFYRPSKHGQESEKERQVRDAYCGRCPVVVECRAYGDAMEVRSSSGPLGGAGFSLGTVHGVIGGETPHQRIRRRKIEQAAAEGMVG